MRGVSFLVAALIVLLVAAGFYFLGGRESDGSGDSDPTAHLPASPAEVGADRTAEQLAALELARRAASADPARRPVDTGGAALAPAAARVRALLMQDGKPLVGARVSVEGFADDTSVDAPVTDREGRVEVGAKPGSYRLSVDHERAPWRWVGPEVRLEAAEVRDLGRIDVPLACGVRGVVRDSSSVPVAGARVFLRQGLLGSLFDQAPPAQLTRTTDAQGRFEILRLSPGGWVVAADHPTYLRLEQPVDLAAGQHVDVGDLRLAKGRELSGVVVDDAGRPVSEARVTYEHTSRAGGNQATYYADERAVPTDAQGRFRLAGLPPQVKLKAQANGFQPLVAHAVDDSAVEVRLVLTRRQGVSGVVTNAAGRSVKVHLAGQGTQGAMGHDVLIGRQRQADVEPDGRFFLPDVPVGVYTIVADAPEFGTSKPRKIRVSENGAHGIELELLAGPTVEVLATDARGQPVVGAKVRLRMPSADGLEMALPPGMDFEPAARGQERQGTTDAQGRAVLAGAWRGRGALTVRHDSYLPARRDDLVLEGDSVRVALTLEGGGWIEGVCTDRSGAPLASIHVRAGAKPKEEPPQPGGRRVVRRMAIGGSGFGPSARVQTDAEGRFRLGPLRPGEYVVRASRKEGGGASLGGGSGAPAVWVGGPDEDGDANQDAVVVAAQTSRVSLILAAPGRVTGFVRHRGAGVAGARVFLRLKGDGQSPLSDFGGEEVTTDGVGRFQVADLRPGAWQISAKPPGGAIPTGPFDVEVREGAETNHDVELGGGVITGQLQRPTGDTRGFDGVEAALAKVGAAQEVRQIMLAMADSSGDARSGGMRMQAPGAPEPVAVGRDGKFRFEYVPAGPWAVRVTGPDDVLLWSKSVDLPKDTGLDLGLVDLDPTWPVEIRVLDPGGQPVSFGSLSIERYRDDGKTTERTWNGMARQGVAKVPGLRAGRYKMTFRAIQMNSDAEPVANEGELEVTADGRVTGTELRLVK